MKVEDDSRRLQTCPDCMITYYVYLQECRICGSEMKHEEFLKPVLQWNVIENIPDLQGTGDDMIICVDGEPQDMVTSWCLPGGKIGKYCTIPGETHKEKECPERDHWLDITCKRMVTGRVELHIKKPEREKIKLFYEEHYT